MGKYLRTGVLLKLIKKGAVFQKSGCELVWPSGNEKLFW